jgi:hypothetical protein
LCQLLRVACLIWRTLRPTFQTPNLFKEISRALKRGAQLFSGLARPLLFLKASSQKEKNFMMNENNDQAVSTTKQNEFSVELFNLSKEFEDIEFVIDELSNTAQMSVVSRRC